MSVKSILLTIVLVNLYIIQAEIIRGVDIPKIDVGRALGKWNFIWGPTPDRTIECLSLVIEQSTRDVVKITGNIIRTPEGTKMANLNTRRPKIESMNCTMKNTSNIFNCNHPVGANFATVVFDTDYDSYIAAFVSDTVEDVIFSQGGAVFLLGRQLTLPNRIIEKTKKSIFYQQSWNSKDYSLYHPTPNCL